MKEQGGSSPAVQVSRCIVIQGILLRGVQNILLPCQFIEYSYVARDYGGIHRDSGVNVQSGQSWQRTGT